MGWADVDGSPDPQEYVRALAETHRDPALRAQLMRVIEALDIRRGQVIVDVGAGSGHVARHVAAAGAKVICLDLSTHMLAAAQAALPNVSLLRADGRRIPLADASVDATIVTGVLQHLSDGARIVAEAKRICRPHGRIVTSDADVAQTTIEGVDPEAAAIVARFYAEQRAGRETVRRIGEVLADVGFIDVAVQTRVRELSSLSECDGMLGIASWGSAAVDEGLLAPHWREEWPRQVHRADAEGKLRLRQHSVFATATTP